MLSAPEPLAPPSLAGAPPLPSAPFPGAPDEAVSPAPDVGDVVDPLLPEPVEPLPVVPESPELPLPLEPEPFVPVSAKRSGVPVSEYRSAHHPRPLMVMSAEPAPFAADGNE